MIYNVRHIQFPHVFIEDENGKTERASFSDFEEKPSLNTSVMKNDANKLTRVNSCIDNDCPGGVCPIK